MPDTSSVTFSELTSVAQTAYTQLLESALAVEHSRTVADLPGSFVTKPVKGRQYWYYQYTEPSGRLRQLYIGPDNEAVRHLVARKSSKSVTNALLPMTRSALALGCAGMLTRHYQVVRRLADYGFFHAGGVLIGTHAFLAYSNMLGVSWGTAARTQDIDFAHPGKSVSLLLAPDFDVHVHKAIESLGMGLLPGDVVISLGTSGTVYAVSDTPTADPSGAVAGFADASGRFLPLVCTLNAMKVTDAVARLLAVDRGAFDDLVLATPAGSGGTVLVPYFDGERTPNRPDATGLIGGLRSDVTRGQLARASVEGVACGLLDGVDALGNAGVPIGGRLFLIGGGSRSAAFRQVVADLTGRSVHVPDADEHVATGACLQAAAVWQAHRGRSTDGLLAQLSSQWRLGGGSVTEPELTVDRHAIRAAYAVARDR